MKGIISGQIISHYRITEKLGSGGMGEIYKAEDIKLKRTVALKFLPSSFSSDEESKKRLTHEAQAASSLDHPNICTIHEIGETDDGLLFISMALYDGETLKDRVEKGPIEIDEAIKITLQICEGLEKAHKSEIIHRDIKPANIFITTDGIVKILDFGLAKSKGQTQLTQMGSTVGTVDYMSPEQATGSVIDKRTDIWSLGVMFYEMITGQRPFAAEYEQAVIYSILNTEPDLSKLSNDLASIINRSVNKSAEQRYQSAEEMKLDLEALRDGTKAKINYVPIRLSRIRLRTKIIAAAASVILLASILYFNINKSSDNAASVPERKMIVVLPFVNLGPPEDEYLGQGMREEISNKLAAFASLGVISRSSAEKIAKANKTAKEIGKELGVDYILEGTIRWSKTKGKESRIRIIPQLVRVSDDVSIWSDSFDKVINDIFNVQNDIAQNVIDKLGIKILPGQTVKGPPPTKNLEAYDYYLKAVQFQYKNSTNSDLLTAIRLFQKAIELDPDFAEAYAQASITYEAVFYWDADRNRKNLEIAKEYLQKAIELKPRMALIHLAKAFDYTWIKNDQQAAFEEFKRTVEIQPSNAEANFWIGGMYFESGKIEEGLKYTMKAIQLDPLTARYPWGIGLDYYKLRDYKNAEKYFNRAIEISHGESSYFADLAKTYIAWKGDIGKAAEIMSQVKDESYLETDENLFIYLSILKRDFNTALDQLKSSGKEYSNNYFTGFIPNSQMIAMVYKYKNELKLSKEYFETSIAEINKKIKNEPNDMQLYKALSISYAGLGERKKVLTEYGRFLGFKEEGIQKNSEIIKSKYPPEICILLENYDQALKQIDSLLSNPAWISVNILKLDPLYDPLRNLPGYKTIIDKHSKQSED